MSARPPVHRWVLWTLLCVGAGAPGCFKTTQVLNSNGADGGPGGSAGHGQPASTSGGAPGSASGVQTSPPPVPKGTCTRGGSCQQVSLEQTDKVDFLFVIDSSASMADKQAALRAQFPHLITIMTTGDLDGDGKNDFPPAKDMHLGVVTGDMGLPGVDGVESCQGLGEDGILQNHPSAGGMGCQLSYPPFLTFLAGIHQPAQTATDFACIALVGTAGCAFEQVLEASLKALWPSVDPMADANGMNRFEFLTDPRTGRGKLGHGDVENISFIRNDAVMGLSVVAIIVLTDQDDCSASDTRPFTPLQFLGPGDPLANQPMNLRCHFNQQSLYGVERYALGWKALRPGHEDLVYYAAITGVPPDLAAPGLLGAVDFTNDAQRNAYYTALLDDPRMQATLSNSGTGNPTDDQLAHSCTSSLGPADPPIRLVQLAKDFGANSIVQSICQDDFGPAIQAIATRIGARLGADCSPKPLARDRTGQVACDVLWRLPPPSAAPVSTPVTCDAPGFDFLLPRAGNSTVTDRGGAICRVVQLAVKQDPSVPGGLAPVATAADSRMFSEGWYYDDFSDEVKLHCRGPNKQRIAFTNNAKPPTGVSVVLDCAK